MSGAAIGDRLWKHECGCIEGFHPYRHYPCAEHRRGAKETASNPDAPDDAFDTHMKGVWNLSQRRAVRVIELQEVLRQIAEFPIREERSAGWHFAEVRAIARAALIEPTAEEVGKPSRGAEESA